MFRATRGRILGLLLSLIVVYFLFFSSSTTSDFRRRTEQGLAAKKHPGHGHGVMQGDISDEAWTKQTNEKLQGVLAKQGDEQQQQNQRDSPNSGSDKSNARTGEKDAAKPRPKSDTKHESADADEEDNVGVAGRRTMTKGSGGGTKDVGAKPKYPVASDQFHRVPLKQAANAASAGEKVIKNGASDSSEGGGGDPSKDIVREKLQEYLKKPVVIFSKSYCPHSKNAKHLLLDLYTITPPPLIVELDQLTEHLPPPSSSSDEDDTTPRPTLGHALQSLLGQITGRRTVPNIMVGMTSIGGNDNVWELHEKGELADRIRELGGRRVTGVEPRHEHDGDGEKKNRAVKAERNGKRRIVEV